MNAHHKRQSTRPSSGQENLCAGIDGLSIWNYALAMVSVRTKPGPWINRGFVGGWALFAGLVIRLTPGDAAEVFRLYRSTDGARTWSEAGQGLPKTVRIEAVAEVQGTWIAGTEKGLWVSRDEGWTWHRPEQPVSERLKVMAVAAAGGRVFAATSEGLWESPSPGELWSPMDAPWANRRVLSVAVVQGQVYAGTDGFGIHRLLPESRTWENLSAGLPEGAQTFGLAEAGDQLYAALYAQGIYRFDPDLRRWVNAGPERPLRLVASGPILFAGRNPGGVAVSRDGGKLWKDANLGLPLQAPTWCLGRVGNTILIGTSGPAGLLRTDDEGGHWVPSDQGLPAGGEAVAFGTGPGTVLAVVITGHRPAIPTGVLPDLPRF